MIGRELGRMHIENEVIVFTEARLSAEDRTAFLTTNLGLVATYTEDEVLTEWTATMDDKIIAYGNLIMLPDTKDTVDGFVIVHPGHRGFGIGKFMARFITDLAIRNRARFILVQAHDEAARKIAEDQDFEVVPDQDRMRKELKWI